ncbi:MAG TPA: hypothetical protein VD997_11700 [Phycisphaerales bacterium]|nr:hypothetical protein [Phycisphaerales bacterium]
MGCRSVVGLSCAIAGAALCGESRAFEGSVNGLGQGSVHASIWAYPNQPPATPTFHEHTEVPNLVMGPNLPGADPRTGFRFITGQAWRTTVNIRAAQGDTVDWHSMLPHVTASSADAAGFVEVLSAEPFGGGARLFTVQWGASDPGVAFHIGWFMGQEPIVQTPIMVGPFNRTDTFLVQVPSGDLNQLRMEVSGAAVSIVPAPGVLGLMGAAGLVALRRRR